MNVPVNWWLSETPDDSVGRAIDRIKRLDDVVRIAVMPDVHTAGNTCVGTAMATRRLVYPAIVGSDIGCGMLAVAFDIDAEVLQNGVVAGRILRGLSDRVPQSRRNRRRLLPWPEGLRLEDLSCRSRLADDALLQMGTLGGGNHFVELQSDDAGQLWLMLHTGSRAVGVAVRDHHLATAETASGSPAINVLSAAGHAYVHDVGWARCYAAANRRAIAGCVAEVLFEVLRCRPIEASRIDCDHNHVQQEVHDGQSVFVHRKGAMPAGEGVLGVLPGSMGTQSYHVEGRGCATSLRSSAHGAGRRLSRSVACDRFTADEVRHQLRNVWYDPRQISFLREEAPHAYKDVRAVLRAQTSLVRVTRTLRPMLAFKGR